MNKYQQPDKNSNLKDRERRVTRINWNIRNKYCRVIEDGHQPRIMPTKEAVEYAVGLGLDLVEIGYDRQNDCSNCKVYNYSKWVYEQKKREKEAKRSARQSQNDLKTVQISLTTDTADMNRIIGHAKEFLENGNRVKISLRFRGRREFEQIDFAKDLMKNVLSNFDGMAALDSAVQLNGKELSCTLRGIKKHN